MICGQFVLCKKRLLTLASCFFSSPELKAPGELIGLDTLSNMNISEISWSIKIIFHLGHHLGGGKAAQGLGPNQMITWFPWQQVSLIGL